MKCIKYIFLYVSLSFHAVFGFHMVVSFHFQTVTIPIHIHSYTVHPVFLIHFSHIFHTYLTSYCTSESYSFYCAIVAECEYLDIWHIHRQRSMQEVLKGIIRCAYTIIMLTDIMLIHWQWIQVFWLIFIQFSCIQLNIRRTYYLLHKYPFFYNFSIFSFHWL